MLNQGDDGLIIALDYMQLSKFLPRSFDWVLLAAVALLVAIGGEAIYSVDLSHGAALLLFKKQALAAGLGFTGLFIISAMQHTLFRSYAKLIFVGATLLLTAVLFFGNTIRQTKGWFVFGGFSFQPVEAAKIALILMLAYIIAGFGRRFERPLFFVGTALVTLVPIGLVLLQPDLGSAVLLGLIWLGLMFLVKVRKLHLAILLGALGVVAVLSWSFLLAPYQKNRLLNFVDPARDRTGSGYNVRQAIIAVGSGQLFGRGLGFGSQSQLRFLPEAQTDFIFSVIAEELGFVGAVVVVLLYGVIFWRLLRIMQAANDDFSAAAAGGVIILFFSQFFVNVGAEIGLLPVTGVPLPFVSYGGSSLLMNLLLIGVMESMVVKKY